jgi:hypothetical protein
MLLYTFVSTPEGQLFPMFFLLEILTLPLRTMTSFGNARACDNAHRACHAARDAEREVEDLVRRLAHLPQRQPNPDA